MNISVIGVLSLCFSITSLHASVIASKGDFQAPPGLSEKVKSAAHSKVSGEIKSIEFYKGESQSGLCSCQVNFKRQIKGTEATDPYYEAVIRIKDGKIIRETVSAYTSRVFPLKSTTLILRLDDNTPYTSVLNLLHALERGTVKVNYEGTTTRDGDHITFQSSPVMSPIPNAANLATIVAIQYDPQKPSFSIFTDNGKQSGKMFSFTQEKEGFRCIGSSWVNY